MTPEKYLKDLVECIQAVRDDLASDRDATKQHEHHLRAGFFHKRKEGILVPLSTQIHRIQLENHDLFILEGYLHLARKLVENPSNRMGYFALRVLVEIGFDKVDVLFAPEVSEQDKKEFCLNDSLSDLLQIQDEKYKVWFLNLIKDERNNLDTESRKLFEKAEASILAGEQVKLSVVKEIRRMLNGRTSRYIRGVQLPDLLKNKTMFEPLKVAFSQLLHGNPISIRVALDPQYAKSNENHTLVMVWNTGLNILIRTKPLVKNADLQKKIGTFLGQADEIWKKFQERRKGYRKK